MAIADELPRDGRTLVWLLEVSTDKFATVSYRWATTAGEYGGNAFEGRILEVGNIQRAFGQDHLPVASATSVVLDNSDFGADFLVAAATMETTGFKARYRLSLGLSDDTANTYQATVLMKTVGIFVCLDFPSREDGKVHLSLADDVLGQIADPLIPPTPNDWLDAYIAATETTGCFGAVTWPNSPQMLVDGNAPTALQFGASYGDSPHIGFPMCTFDVVRTPADFDLTFFPAGRRPYVYPILVLAARDSAALAASDITKLQGLFRKDVVGNTAAAGGRCDIPSTATFQIVGGSVTLKIWKAFRTDVLNVATGDGSTTADWRLLWIALDVGAYATWVDDGQKLVSGGSSTGAGFAGGGTGSAPITSPFPLGPGYGLLTYTTAGSAIPATPPPNACNALFTAFQAFGIQGGPGSQITDATGHTVNSWWYGNPQAILQDLIQYYSLMGATAVDTTRFTRAKLFPRDQVRGDLIVSLAKVSPGQQLNGKSEWGNGQLRKTIAEIAASTDIDLFVTLAGQVGIVSGRADFRTQTDSHAVIDEERMANVKERVPSAGQRWQPYNRVYLQREGTWFDPGNDLVGPYDEPVSIAAWGRIITKILPGKWVQRLQRRSTFFQFDQAHVSEVWGSRGLEAKVRGILEFTTDLGVLTLDLGDNFTTSWTRGGNNSAYASALWQIESMNIQPNTGLVDISAVWVGDLQTTQPFLLDSEALVVRAAVTFGQTLTCTTGSTTVVRSAGSFIADGLAAGDHLWLRDATEAATAFTRNRQIAVVSITDATHAVVADSVFGSVGAHVLADTDWTMMKSYLTYPTSSSDPANYPSGAAMYGKVSNFAKLFSDGTAANQLLDG